MTAGRDHWNHIYTTKTEGEVSWFEPLPARRARRGLALSYPRDRWFVRVGVQLENALRRARANTFRTFVHPVADMQQLIRASGFDLVSRAETAAWAADIYARRLPTESGQLRD